MEAKSDDHWAMRMDGDWRAVTAVLVKSSSYLNAEASVLASLADVYLVRHGETEWSLSGQHTGLTDLPLTPNGEQQSRWLQRRLHDVMFAKVFTSPLQRAMQTCAIAGYASTAEAYRDLVEWNYGDYEGKKREEIVASRPGWSIFRDGCPNGESPAEVSARADQVISRFRQVNDRVLVFSSGHILRTVISRWLGLSLSAGGFFSLGTASLTVLGYDHNNEKEPLIRLLNETAKEIHRDGSSDCISSVAK